MKLLDITCAAVLGLAGISAATHVSWHASFGDAGTSLMTTACSDGSNGLYTRYGWQKLGDIPTFPNVGGVAGTVGGWNSPQCGTCWAITYEGITIYVTAIEVNNDISKQALDTLTGGRAEQLGSIEATTIQVNKSKCSL